MADQNVAAESCIALGATEHQLESYPDRDIALGALTVTRVLPVKGKRLVGRWCCFGGDLQVHPGAALDIPLEPACEDAALVLSGDCALEGQPLQERVLTTLAPTAQASVS